MPQLLAVCRGGGFRARPASIEALALRVGSLAPRASLLTSVRATSPGSGLSRQSLPARRQGEASKLSERPPSPAWGSGPSCLTRCRGGGCPGSGRPLPHALSPVLLGPRRTCCQGRRGARGHGLVLPRTGAPETPQCGLGGALWPEWTRWVRGLPSHSLVHPPRRGAERLSHMVGVGVREQPGAYVQERQVPDLFLYVYTRCMFSPESPINKNNLRT